MRGRLLLLGPRALWHKGDNNLLSIPVCKVNAPSPRCLIYTGSSLFMGRIWSINSCSTKLENKSTERLNDFPRSEEKRAESACTLHPGGWAGWLNVTLCLLRRQLNSWLVLYPSSPFWTPRDTRKCPVLEIPSNKAFGLLRWCGLTCHPKREHQSLKKKSPNSKRLIGTRTQCTSFNFVFWGRVICLYLEATPGAWMAG